MSCNRTESKIQVKSIKSTSKVIFTGLTQQRGTVVLKIHEGKPEAFPTGLIRAYKGIWGCQDWRGKQRCREGLWRLLPLFIGELVQRAKRSNMAGLHSIPGEKWSIRSVEQKWALL